MNEVWERLEPESGLASKYTIDMIVDDEDGLVAHLTAAENCPGYKKITISFPGQQSYSRTFIEYQEVMLKEINDAYDGMLDQWFLFKVTESRYLDRLREEGGFLFEMHPFVQYSIVATESVFEVVSTDEPDIDIIEE